MQKISPFLWYHQDTEAAIKFYVDAFPNSKILHIDYYPDESLDEHFKGMSGKVINAVFEINGYKMMALDGGPIFNFNPGISMFCTFKTQAEIDAVWRKLSEGAKVLMDYQEYPWAERYGWLQDKWGLSWQLSLSKHHQTPQPITPLLTFTQDQAGKAKEAMEFYVSIFKDSGIDMISEYQESDGDKPGYIKRARFHLGGDNFMAMDSSARHDWNFHGAVSLFVSCKDQAEIDYYWEKLSASPEHEQCGWLQDKYGVSWQIIPENMGELLSTDGAIQKMMKMKKIIIADLSKS